MGAAFTDNVVPFRAVRRLTRDNVLVLSLYETRRAALDSRSRGTLAHLEALLFQEGVDEAQKAMKAYPADVRFEISTGSIYHAWCPVLECFTLCDFELGPAGGGVECGRGGLLTRCATAMQTVRRAARSVASAASLPTRIWTVAVQAYSSVLGHVLRLAAPGSRRAGAIGKEQLLSTPRLVLLDGGIERWGVAAAHPADWSLLGGLASVSAELESSFSRSILFGEYLCQIGYALDTAGRPPFFDDARSTRRKASRRRRLFDESLLIISSLARSERVDDRANMFLTGDFALRDLAADERLMALVRSELVMRVSSSVYVKLCSSGLDADGWPDRLATERAERSSAFRHFALVAELSGLADRCFSGPAVADVARAVLADYARGGRRRRLETAVNSIAGYDRWVAEARLDRVYEEDCSGATREDIACRLRAVLGELLGVDEHAPKNFKVVRDLPPSFAGD